MITEFWDSSAVNIFGTLYEVNFNSVYSGTGKAKLTSQDVQRCVKAFYEALPGTVSFNTTNLFVEEYLGVHNCFREVDNTINGEASLNNCKHI